MVNSKFKLLATFLFSVLALTACNTNSGSPGSGVSNGSVSNSQGGVSSGNTSIPGVCSEGSGGKVLRISSGSENHDLCEDPKLAAELQKFEQSSGIDIVIDFAGSVELANQLSSFDANGQNPSDAFWFASQVWAQIGDQKGITSDGISVAKTPIVIGIREDKFQQLLKAGKLKSGVPLTYSQLLKLMQSGEIKVAMTSPALSNSGTMAYLGILTQLANRQGSYLTEKDLDNPKLLQSASDFVKKVALTSNSSGFLRLKVLENPDQANAMINYEVTLLETNLALKNQNKPASELFHLVYLDGSPIADSFLTFVNGSQSTEKLDVFNQFKQFLLSPGMQNALLMSGRRTGPGLAADAKTPICQLTPGCDFKQKFRVANAPDIQVILKALTLYQTDLRLPAVVAIATDYSGSMNGEPEQQMEDGLLSIMQTDQAAKNFMTPTEKDLRIVVPFDSTSRQPYIAKGKDIDQMVSRLVQEQSADGGTNIYGALVTAYEELAEAISKDPSLKNSRQIIVLMSDGADGGGSSIEEVLKVREELGLQNVPVFPIAFGSSNDDELKQIAESTGGRVINGRANLARGYRDAVGNAF